MIVFFVLSLSRKNRKSFFQKVIMKQVAASFDGINLASTNGFAGMGKWTPSWFDRQSSCLWMMFSSASARSDDVQDRRSLEISTSQDLSRLHDFVARRMSPRPLVLTDSQVPGYLPNLKGGRRTKPVSTHTWVHGNQGKKDEDNPTTHGMYQIQFGSMFIMPIAMSRVVSSTTVILLASWSCTPSNYRYRHCPILK